MSAVERVVTPTMRGLESVGCSISLIGLLHPAKNDTAAAFTKIMAFFLKE